jgi:hypothetical protein
MFTVLRTCESATKSKESLESNLIAEISENVPGAPLNYIRNQYFLIKIPSAKPVSAIVESNSTSSVSVHIRKRKLWENA